MKQISKLIINNLGPTKHLEVDFTALTSVVGANSCGKTVLIYNVLEALLLNEELSQSFIRYGETSGNASIVFTDGTSIYRERNNNKQTVILKDERGTETIFKDKLPDNETIRKFTGFDYISFDGGKTTESLQFVPIDASQTYLISGISPENVLKRLSTIMCGGELEQVLQKLNSRLLSTNKELKLRQDDLKKLQIAEEKNFAGLPNVVSLVDKLEQADKAIIEKKEELNILNTLITMLVSCELFGEISLRQENVVELFKELEDNHTKIAEVRDSLATVADLIFHFNRSGFDSISMDTVTQLDNALIDLEKYKLQIDEIINTGDELAEYITLVEETKKELKLKIQEQEDLQTEITLEQEKTPVCPECGRELL